MTLLKKVKEEGGEILVGGEAIDGKGYYVAPTVFTNVSNDMTVAQEEIFGLFFASFHMILSKKLLRLLMILNTVYLEQFVGYEEEAVEVAKQMKTGEVFNQWCFK